MNDIIFALIINGIVFAVWLFLFFKDKERALKAVKVGCQIIFSMMPFLLIVMGLIGIFSSFADPDIIAQYLGDKSGMKGFFSVAIMSSFLQIPGIVIFPMAAALYNSGAAAGIVAVFISASTMASIFTMPLEMKYLGRKLPPVRIALIFVISLAIGFSVEFVFRLLNLTK